MTEHGPEHAPIRRVGIVAKRGSQPAVATAGELVDWLERHGLAVFLEAGTQAALGRQGAELIPAAGCDLVVVLGGDGTLLAVARTLAPGVPILGVNLGNLGFLTEVGPAGLYPALEQVLAGSFATEMRSLFDVELRSGRGGAAGAGSQRFRVLNDAVITKSALSRIIDLIIEVDGHLIARYRSDGLIISTPTGSTAYNLSAGGTIVHPLLPVAVLTPICPHELSLRPIVVPGSSRIEVTLATQPEEVFLTLDGQEGTELAYRDVVAVTQSTAAVRLVKVSDRSFYDNLREKLRWGGIERPGGGGPP